MTYFAILPFECTDALGGAQVGELAAKTMTLALVERNGYEVASSDEVKKVLATSQTKPPYLAADMVSLGKQLGVDRVIRGRVEGASIAGKPKTAVVELTTKVVDVATGAVVHETRARGTARESGAGRATDEDLRSDALKDAARQSAAQLTVLKGLRGIVVSRPGDTTARLSVGSDSGMEPGARVAVFDKGTQVAEGTVTEVAQADSVIKFSTSDAAKGVRVGQRFQTVATPAPDVRAEQTVEQSGQADQKKSGKKFLIGLLVAAGLYLLLRGGGGGGGAAATTTSTTASLTLVATPTAIAADGQSTSTITILARDQNGNPVADGSELTLTTTLGIIPATATTSAGVATASLRATTTPGIATVTVKLGTLTQSLTVTLTSTATSPVVVAADVDSVPADGRSQATITATFRDANNNPVPDGSSVTWTTTLGSLAARSRQASRQTGVSTTTLSGSTSVALTSSQTPGTAVITATLTGTNTKATTTVAFTTTNVQVAVSPQSIIADGNSTSTITATVLDSTGKPVADGTVVRFLTSLGTIKSPSTTFQGTAQSTLKSATQPGTARVVVEVLDADSKVIARNDATFIDFTAGPATLIAIAPATCNIRGLDVVGAATSLIVSLKDRYGNPVRDGTVVHFTSNKGTVQGTAVTQQGIATVFFRSNGGEDGNNGTPPKNGIALVRATTTTSAPASTLESRVESTTGDNTVLYDETTIILSGPAVSSGMTLQLGSTSVRVGTANRDPGVINFTLIVLDENANFVVNGTSVTVTANQGTVATSGGTVDGCQASVVTGPYTAPTVEAGFAGGTDRITATVGFASTSATIQLLP